MIALAAAVKEPGVRSDVDDATALLRHHDPSRLLSAKKSTLEIGRQYEIPLRIGDLEKRFPKPKSGVIDQNIEPAEFSPNGIE